MTCTGKESTKRRAAWNWSGRARWVRSPERTTTDGRWRSTKSSTPCATCGRWGGPKWTSEMWKIVRKLGPDRPTGAFLEAAGDRCSGALGAGGLALAGPPRHHAGQD